VAVSIGCEVNYPPLRYRAMVDKYRMSDRLKVALAILTVWLAGLAIGGTVSFIWFG